MSYQMRVDPEKRRVTFAAHGVLDRSEILQGIREMVDHPDFQPGYSVLVDLSEVAAVPISGPEIRERVELDRSLAHRIGKARFAIVARQDYVFGLARMYEMMMENGSVEVGTFRDLEQARSWLEER